MIVLLVSLATLLSAAAAVARHICVQRDKLRSQTVPGAPRTSSTNPGQLIDPAEDLEHDLET